MPLLSRLAADPHSTHSTLHFRFIFVLFVFYRFFNKNELFYRFMSGNSQHWVGGWVTGDGFERRTTSTLLVACCVGGKVNIRLKHWFTVNDWSQIVYFNKTYHFVFWPAAADPQNKVVIHSLTSLEDARPYCGEERWMNDGEQD